MSFIGKRFAQLIPTLLGVVVITFLIMRMIPGDPTSMAGGQTISEDVRKRLRAEWHLDDPPLTQMWYYIKGIPKGDLGISMRFGTPVSERIGQHFARTIQLGLAAFFLSVTVGLSLGIIAALMRDTWVDRTILALALLGISTPVFVVGIGLVMLAAALGYNYISGTGADSGFLVVPPLRGWNEGSELLPALDLRYLVLPAITLGSRSIAYLSRMTRSAVLEIANADFLRTARAKGLTERAVVFKHQLRNAMIPITTVVGLSFADYLTGAILTESVFQWPGLGFLVRKAIEFRDLPVIMGTVLFVTFLFVTINFIVDILYAYFDPRIRYS
ncbi:MAG: ABC transporter permease [Candidatus Sumerlaeaceae bacterium]